MSVSVDVEAHTSSDTRRMSLTSFGGQGELEPTLSMTSGQGGYDVDAGMAAVSGDNNSSGMSMGVDNRRANIGMVNFGSPTSYASDDEMGGQTPFNQRNSMMSMLPPPPSHLAPVPSPLQHMSSPPTGPPPMMPPPPPPPPPMQSQPPPGMAPVAGGSDLSYRTITATAGKASPQNDEDGDWM